MQVKRKSKRFRIPKAYKTVLDVQVIHFLHLYYFKLVVECA